MSASVQSSDVVPYVAPTPPPSNYDKLATLRPMLDPDNQHGPRKVWSAMKAAGLEPADLEPSTVRRQVARSPKGKIPEKYAGKIKEHKTQVLEELRQTRVREVQKALDDMGGHRTGFKTEDLVRRYERVGDYVRPVRSDDLPRLDDMADMAEFSAMQRAHHDKIREEQQHKATQLGLTFLEEKRRAKEADEKILNLENRLVEYRKGQEAALKQRRQNLEQAAEKRRISCQRAAQDRAEWESKQEKALAEKMAGATARRTVRYSKDTVSAKHEAARKKREEAFQQAVESEAQMVQRIEEDRQALDERLEEHRQQEMEKLQRRAEESQAKFQQRQVAIHRMNQEWAQKKLEEHQKFKEKLANVQDVRSKSLKEISKAVGTKQRAAAEKAHSSHTKILQGFEDARASMAAKMKDQSQKQEFLRQQKLDNDRAEIAFRTMKHQTMVDVQRMRRSEQQRKEVAETQALLFRVAENRAMEKAKSDGQLVLQRARQQMYKDAMTFSDTAHEAFIKIQAEPDERKVRDIMLSMGFEMPELRNEVETVTEEPKPKAAY